MVNSTKPRTPTQARSIQRREDIIQTAWTLIVSRGFEATSVNTIIRVLGISKGSFYHHFESKEAVLDAVVEMLTREVADRESQEHKHQPAIERLAAFIRSGWDWHAQHAAASFEILVVMLRAENQTLLARLAATEQRVFRPLLEDILDQGIEEGAFDAPSAILAADLLMPMLSDALMRIAQEAMNGVIDGTGFIDRMRYMQHAIERVLGLPVESLNGAAPESARQAAVRDFIDNFQTTPANESVG